MKRDKVTVAIDPELGAVWDAAQAKAERYGDRSHLNAELAAALQRYLTTSHADSSGSGATFVGGEV